MSSFRVDKNTLSRLSIPFFSTSLVQFYIYLSGNGFLHLHLAVCTCQGNPTLTLFGLMFSIATSSSPSLPQYPHARLHQHCVYILSAMSSSYLPCSDPYMYPGSRCAPEIVSLGVGSGSDTEVLEAPLRYLRLISYYFNDR